MDPFYKELEKFGSYSQQLIDKSGLYPVVIASHELFRFTQPGDNYANFWQDDKNLTGFITDKIIALNSFLKVSLDSVAFYKLDLDKVGKIEQNNVIEELTPQVYTTLWNQFDLTNMLDEAVELIKRRVPADIIENNIKGKVVLDMGCGSGRYSLALSKLGAAKVIAVDLGKSSYQNFKQFSEQNGFNVEFMEASFLDLPLEKESVDFVFSNGTLHHSKSIDQGLNELHRILKNKGKSFIYLYADRGYVWETRKAIREIFKRIPIEYTNEVLHLMAMPTNRFWFADCWHVPLEAHTTKQQVEDMFSKNGLSFQKVVSKDPLDLDNALVTFSEPGASTVFGDGEHRYILEKN